MLKSRRLPLEQLHPSGEAVELKQRADNNCSLFPQVFERGANKNLISLIHTVYRKTDYVARSLTHVHDLRCWRPLARELRSNLGERLA